MRMVDIASLEIGRLGLAKLSLLPALVLDSCSEMRTHVWVVLRQVLGALQTLAASKGVESLVEDTFITVLWQEAIVSMLSAAVHRLPVIGISRRSLNYLDHVLSVTSSALIAHAIGVTSIQRGAVVHVALLAF